MRYKIFENGVEINVIVAELEFVESYCKKYGYTYEEDILPEPTRPEEETDEVSWDAMAEAISEGVNEV